ncbi:BTB POZ domain containing [Arthrobotrys musiformis]|uniref:BTB POZ domain containing n=1 Tax=Arthrobotrys musiformis TaxID=47236 RepID=A0AAV9WRC2_9PEZI
MYLYTEPDVMLAVEDTEIPAHESVLASQSEFFKAELHRGSTESQGRRIELPGISAGDVVTVLNWLYRAPKVPHYHSDADRFSKEAAENLRGIMQACDFLQIEGARKEYSAYVEESLNKIGTANFPKLLPKHASSIAIQLNEVYKCGSAISKEPMRKLVGGIEMGGMMKRQFTDSLITALEQLPDPDGRCFRDLAAALIRGHLPDKLRDMELLY